MDDPDPMEGHESASKMADEPATTKDADDQDDGGQVESVNIRVAEGGFIASCSRRPKGSDGGNTPFYQAPKDYVFRDLDELMDYVRGELDGGY